MRLDPLGFPVLPDPIRQDPKTNAPLFGHYTLKELEECILVCEVQLAMCHPESAFVPLIRKDLVRIHRTVKRRKFIKRTLYDLAAALLVTGIGAVVYFFVSGKIDDLPFFMFVVGLVMGLFQVDRLIRRFSNWLTKKIFRS